MATIHASPTVLVVDDERDYLDTMALLLRSQGYRVLTAAGGEPALRQLSMQPVDVVLTDLAMPDYDGFRLLQAVRRQPRCCDALVIAVSGWGGRATAARCAAAGFDAFFVKPCNLRDLLWTMGAGLMRVGGGLPSRSGEVG
ncbi:response regulator [Ramlibacter sp. MMS24-I3-19]|uniref:response regulator n=1 Tax=Ramlibacter sp. MMS24-I3-19 TaxID=3416606 RepID=UPI003CFD7541